MECCVISDYLCVLIANAMTILEILVIAVGLAMDAFAVSICKGMSVERIKVGHALGVGVWFGGFQALMPLAGYLLGVRWASAVERVDHWIAFVLLCIIGVNMVRESLSHEEKRDDGSFSMRAMFPLAVATSIDALAVGISLAFLGVSIELPVCVIGVVTFVLSVVGLWLGNRFGNRYKGRAELAGGIILIAIGVKIVIEHLSQGV